MTQSDEIRSALSVALGEPVLSSVDVRVAVGTSDFERVVPPGTPRGSGPVAISQARLLVIGLPSGPLSTSKVSESFRRGLAHLALDEVAGYNHLPRWIRVGFALHFSTGATLARSRALFWASLERRMLPLTDLDHHLKDRSDHDSVAAAQAADFVRYLIEEDESGEAWPLLVHAAQDEALPAAVRTAYQRSAGSLEQEWREDVAKHKAFMPILGAGTALWVLLAAAVQLRQRLRSRKEEGEERGKKKKKKRGRPKPKMVRHGKSKRRRAPSTQIPEPEVPKVSHNGRWHTLH
jgi:hypothetical protein